MSDPQALWRQADQLADQARLLLQDADALISASKRLSALAAAINDGRYEDVAEIARSIGA